jgi:transcriptional regulator with XRE-family HTH domain
MSKRETGTRGLARDEANERLPRDAGSDRVEVAEPMDDGQLDPGLPNVGAILQRMRQQRGMSLQDVADATGLSPSFLSAVERGKSDIALRRLARVAAVFHHDVGSLLGYSARQARPQFVQGGDRLRVDRGDGIDYAVLRPPGVDFELIVATFGPRAQFRDAITHEGLDITYVARGELVLVYNDEEYALPTGECVVYSAAYPHRFRNDTDDYAQFINVVTATVY